MLDAILGFIGKGIDAYTSSSNAEKNNATQLQIAQQNLEQQEKFAKQGISWKVADAQAAGLHPLAALGAQTTSYQPVSVGDLALPKTSFGEMGQDLGRAMSAGQNQVERDSNMGSAVAKVAQTFQLEKMNLENELLKTSIAKERAQLPPPMPLSVPIPRPGPPRTVAGDAIKDKDIEQQSSDAPALRTYRPWGYNLRTNPYFSDGQANEDRLGDAEIGNTAKWIVNNVADHLYTGYTDWLPALGGYLSDAIRGGDRSRYRYRKRY